MKEFYDIMEKCLRQIRWGWITEKLTAVYTAVFHFTGGRRILQNRILFHAMIK